MFFCFGESNLSPYISVLQPVISQVKGLLDLPSFRTSWLYLVSLLQKLLSLDNIQTRLILFSLNRDFHAVKSDKYAGNDLQTSFSVKTGLRGDVNGDNDINVTDNMGIANIILGVSTNSSRASRVTDEVEPQ